MDKYAMKYGGGSYRAPNVKNPLIRQLPGVSAAGTRGPVVNTAAIQQRIERPEAVSPLQSFQEKMRQRIQEGERFTQDINQRVKTRTGFQKKYGIKNFQNTWQQQPQQRQPSAGAFRGVTSTRGWGGYSNGQIPASALRGISFARGHMLRSDAASALERMNADYRRQFGHNIGITDSYRSLQSQIRLASGPRARFAARPGTSVHGLGMALDLSGPVARYGSRQNQWLQQNAGRYGFGWPTWARNPRRFEPWHWEYRG